MLIKNKTTGEIIARITEDEVILMNTKDYEMISINTEDNEVKNKKLKLRNLKGKVTI